MHAGGRLLTVVGCLGALLGVAGCGRFVPETDPDTDVLTAGHTSVLVETEEFTGSVAGVGVEARLRIVHGCVGMGTGDTAVVLLFASGTSVRGADRHLVIDTGGQELQIGDRFSAGTRSSPEGKPMSSFGDLGETSPESCRYLNAVPIDLDG